MDKNVKLFFEEVESDYHEAVIGKQISPKGRDLVAKSRSGHKKIDSNLLSKKVLDKNFHMLSPAEKKRIKKTMGFGKNKKKVGKIIMGSSVDPDDLYMMIDEEGYDDEFDGQTFIWNDKLQILSTLPAINTHYDIEMMIIRGGVKEFGDKFPDLNVDIYGRWMKIPYASRRDSSLSPKGSIHLALWVAVDGWREQLNKTLNKLNATPDVIHVPSEVDEEENW